MSAKVPPSILPRDAHVEVRSPVRTRPDAVFASVDGLPSLDGNWRATIFPSLRPNNRDEALRVEAWLERAVQERERNRKGGSLEDELADVDNISSLLQTLTTALHELCRQVTVECADRGRVLWRAWCLVCQVVEQLLAVIATARREHGDVLRARQARYEEAVRSAQALAEQLAAETARAEAAEATIGKLRAQHGGLLSEGERLHKLAAEMRALIANRDELNALLVALREAGAASARENEALQAQLRKQEQARRQAEFEKQTAEELNASLNARVADLTASIELQRAEARRTAVELAETRRQLQNTAARAQAAAAAAAAAEQTMTAALGAQKPVKVATRKR